MWPRDAKLIDVADVYKGDHKAGTLVRTSDGTEFRYRDDYRSEHSVPIASTLPLRLAPYRSRSGALPAFFTGLLPEGTRLQAVITAVETSADDELSLLLAVGSDTVGDVRIVPRDAALANTPNELPSDPSKIFFAELLERSVDPMTDLLDRALPGVQEKLSDSMISFPIKRAKRPAILKLDPAAYPLITRNEHFFLSLARKVGFSVPPHELITDADGDVGLLVRRFDREQGSNGEMIRIAQEDGCQLLGRYPAEKYRVTINDIAEGIQNVATAPQAAVLDLVRQVAFAWMIGNGDLHGKNYSLQWRPDSVVTATPVYDIVSTLAYPVNQQMALRMDGRDDNFSARYFIAFAERFGIPETLTSRKLREMASRCEAGIADIGTIGYGPDTTKRMRREIQRRIKSIHPG